MKIIRVGDNVEVEYGIRDMMEELQLDHPSLTDISIDAISGFLWWIDADHGYNWYSPKVKHFRLSVRAYNQFSRGTTKFQKGDPDTNFSVGDSKADIIRKLTTRIICLHDLVKKKLDKMKKDSEQFDFEVEVNPFRTKEERKQKKMDNIIKEVEKINETVH